MRSDFITYVAIAALMFIIGVWILPQVRNILRENPVEQQAGWCLKESLPRHGGSFGEVEGGEYNYLVLQTESGVKVFEHCEGE